MRKIFIAISILFFIQQNSIAQVFACQFVISSGADWDGGAWKATRFINYPPFFINIKDGSVTDESASKAMNAGNFSIKCFKDQRGRHTCIDGTSTTFLGSGSMLFFDPSTLNGASTSLLGSTLIGKQRDSVSVRLFTCQRV